jgi:hypothetical protein
MVLDADFEKIARFAPPRPVAGTPQISPDLGKSNISDLLFAEVFQALDIITVPFPFGGGYLVRIAYKLFRNGDGLRQDTDFLCLEGKASHLLGSGNIFYSTAETPARFLYVQNFLAQFN